MDKSSYQQAKKQKVNPSRYSPMNHTRHSPMDLSGGQPSDQLGGRVALPSFGSLQEHLRRPKTPRLPDQTPTVLASLQSIESGPDEEWVDEQKLMENFYWWSNADQNTFGDTNMTKYDF